jgi:hypothetical protein
MGRKFSGYVEMGTEEKKTEKIKFAIEEKIVGVWSRFILYHPS